MGVYCVTGGTGFIGAYLVKRLLDEGHSVRATVRDPGDTTKVGFLRQLNIGANHRLQIVRADLMEQGSFDDAVKGADGVFHAASPVITAHDDDVERTLIEPCVKGTLNVLESCAKFRSSVKRVVLTSSCSAVRYRHDVQQVSPLNESHWTDPDYCKHYDLWYAYAKTIGEKEAWRMAKEKGIDLVVVNPSFVVGPLLAPQPTSTLLVILSVIKGLQEEYPNMTIGFVHIDDVVGAHILAMEHPQASGRLICSGPVAHWSQIINMLRDTYPSYPYIDKCGGEVGNSNPHGVDTTKIRQLGFPEFKTLAQMFDDCITSFQQKGFL